MVLDHAFFDERSVGMSFWNLEEHSGEALVTSDHSYTYAELLEAIYRKQTKLKSSNKQLILLFCENSYDVLVTYLAALRSCHAVMLVSAEIDEKLKQDIVETYKPTWIQGSEDILGYECVGENLLKRTVTEYMKIHDNLAVLLSTSGTTGSQKFVRLSYNNLQANAESIATYLQLNERERGVANLPISYSYGLSIVNSHLVVGATILLTDESVMAKSFWAFIDEQKATSFPGVPFTYQMLQRIGFLKKDLPHLRYFTQAGGRLDERLVRLFGEYAQQNCKQFYVMYGQTEASPRISYIPTDKLLDKASTIGVPIPNGEMEIDSETSELIYKGPNVMMGYATSFADLEKGDVLHGVLHTGDTASVDEDGYYTITGRMKRFVKLFGLRVNLDEVEKRLEKDIQSPVACSGNDDRLKVIVESEDVKPIVRTCLESVYKLHKSAYRIHVVESIPRMGNGKIDYSAIKEWLI
jgi:long-chain acyl-CoA synthetase